MPLNKFRKNFSMKYFKILPVFLLIFNSFGLYAQYNQPVTWEYEIKKIDEETYEFISTATIQRLWQLYGQFFSEAGPTRLKFVYDDNNNGESIELDGVTEEFPTPSTFQDPILGVEIQYFTEKATFTQKIRFKKKTDIKVYINGLAKNKMTKGTIIISTEHLFKMI